MQKLLFFLILLLLVSFTSMAQLTKTKWKGKLLIPDETEAILNFKTDTLEAFVENGGTLLETMTYTVKGDTLLIKKLSGSSNCDESVTGRYKWVMQGSSLLITPVADECSNRFQAWNNQPFTKMKD